MIKHYMDKIIEKGKQEDMEELGEIFRDMYEHIEECDPEEAHDIKTKMYEMACGKVITEEMAHEWVNSMLPYHEHWDKETTESVRNERGIEVEPTEWYVVLNMMYNDYFKAIQDDTETYIKLAIQWLKDEDAVKDKLYEYKKYIVE